MTRSASATSTRDVHTTLNFYVPLGPEDPYQYVFTPPEGTAHNNLGSEARPVIVQDVRNKRKEYDLDKNGFQYVHWPSAQTDFTDPETIKSKYYGDVEHLLKSVTGAKRVLIFDHTLRLSATTETLDNLGARGPVERVHVDQTYEAARARVHRHLPQDANRLLSSRVRIINVWRPIQSPVAHKPLAVGDWRTVLPDDLVSVRLIYPDRQGSTFSVRYNPSMRFYYLSYQTPDEVTLIKCFDSADDGTARLTPHSAFTDSGSPPEAPHRQSIEVRALVFDSL